MPRPHFNLSARRQFVIITAAVIVLMMTVVWTSERVPSIGGRLMLTALVIIVVPCWCGGRSDNGHPKSLRQPFGEQPPRAALIPMRWQFVRASEHVRASAALTSASDPEPSYEARVFMRRRRYQRVSMWRWRAPSRAPGRRSPPSLDRPPSSAGGPRRWPISSTAAKSMRDDAGCVVRPNCGEDHGRSAARHRAHPPARPLTPFGRPVGSRCRGRRRVRRRPRRRS